RGGSPMSDLNAMGTFEKYVHGLSLLTPDQIKKCKNVQHTLREIGIAKGLEEITVRLGLMTSEKLASVLGDIRAKWQITIPRPVIVEMTTGEDQKIQEGLVQKSPQGATQVIECRQIQEEAAKLGIVLKVADVLIAKGYHVPAGAGPAAGESAVSGAQEAGADEEAVRRRASEAVAGPRRETAVASRRQAGRRTQERRRPRAEARRASEAEEAAASQDHVLDRHR